MAILGIRPHISGNRGRERLITMEGTMVDVTEGSSGAAHRAQLIEQPDMPPRGGFLKRIADAFGSAQPGDGAEVETVVGLAPAAPERAAMSNLRRLRVEDVAIPAVEIVSVPEDIAKDKLVSVFRESGLSRLPVYRETLDHPLGLIHMKDFALQHGFNGDQPDFNFEPLLRPLLFVPPSMPLSVLLQRMQSERRHMALVIDEYGGVDGLLTIEDLIEQVVGEIEDEHDSADEELWTREPGGSYLALARTPLDEFEAEIGLKLVDAEGEEEIDTLGGVLFVLCGRVPTRGEVIPHPSGAEFEILDADPRRIKRLRVCLPKGG